jgi:hypothetical protein
VVAAQSQECDCLKSEYFQFSAKGTVLNLLTAGLTPAGCFPPFIAILYNYQMLLLTTF